MKREMHPIEPEELMAYLDGELTAQGASEAAGHVRQCRECQSAAAEMQSVSRRLLEWEIEEPGPRVELAINSAPTLERPQPIWRRTVPWIAGLAAACLLLLIWAPLRQRPAAERFVATGEYADEYVRRPQRGQSQQGQVRAFVPLAPLPQAAPRDRAHSMTTEKGPPRDPLVIRTAQITLTTSNFAQARASVDDILKRHGGHIGLLNVSTPADSGQTLHATLRVPANQLDAALAEIRHLGHVETEQQGGEEVTGQMVDLDARLTNAQNTEQRLAGILRGSTSKMADILAVEKEIDRVRGEIERMDAEGKNLRDRVDFATLDVRINEEYQAHLAVPAPSTLGRLRNSAVEGYRNLADSLTGIATFVLGYGPALIMWAVLLFLPARYAWRRFRKSQGQ